MADKAVSRKELARILGIEERTITNLRRRHQDFPVKVRGRSVTFPVARCRRWWAVYQEKLAEQRSGKEKDGPQRDIELRTKTAQMRMVEATAAERLKELLPSSEVRSEISALLGGLRAAIDAMPQEHAHRILHKTNVIEAAAALKEIALHLLRSLRRVKLPSLEGPETSERRTA